MAKSKSKSSASGKKKGDKVTTPAQRMSKVAEEITGGPIEVKPEGSTTPEEILRTLRDRAVQAHRSGTAEELTAAVKALIEAGDLNPPPEALAVMHRWGIKPGEKL